jgi:phenylalanyl-tRNA synthetase beta chain
MPSTRETRWSADRRAPRDEGESIVTLDGKTRALSSRMLVIADAVKPVVVAGVMGGENSGVDASTTDLVLEAAYFRRQSIRATSKRMALSSDSSYRYERGVDPHALPEAARRAVNLILQTAGGQLVGPQFSVGGDVPWQREILLSPDFVNERLGFAVPAADMKAALESLELTVAREEEGASRASSGPLKFQAGATTSTARLTWWRRSCASMARSASPPRR